MRTKSTIRITKKRKQKYLHNRLMYRELSTRNEIEKVIKSNIRVGGLIFINKFLFTVLSIRKAPREDYFLLTILKDNKTSHQRISFSYMIEIVCWSKSLLTIS